MGDLMGTTHFKKDDLLSDILRILEDMTSDWEMGFQGKINLETRLVADLGFESIDVVQLSTSIEERFHRLDLPFQKLLMVDGRYIDDLKVADLVNFLDIYLNQS
jgi:acyl carrier protein